MDRKSKTYLLQQLSRATIPLTMQCMPMDKKLHEDSNVYCYGVRYTFPAHIIQQTGIRPGSAVSEGVLKLMHDLAIAWINAQLIIVQCQVNLAKHRGI